jgi:tRNA dimethylallyltransferase
MTSEAASRHAVRSSAPLLIVSGSTASGKSSLALALAQALRGEIVNLDSMQVYQGCSIGSAKPSAQQQATLPHHLFDILKPSEQMDAGHYLNLARNAIAEIQTRAAQPVFVGGSSMYLSLLLSGLADLPKSDLAVRQQLQTLSNEQAYAQLQQRDPQRAAQLHPADRIRVLRALEVLCSPQGMPEGATISAIYAQQAQLPQPYVGLCLIPCWQRDVLYQRIEMRCQQMLAEGFVQEVRELREQYGAAAQHALASVGYAQVNDFLDGQLTEPQLLEEISKQTRRYAKRQMTFWRNEPGKRGWLSRPTDAEEGLELGRNPASKASRGVRAFCYSFPELRRRVEQRLAEAFSCTEVWYLDARRLEETVS